MVDIVNCVLLQVIIPKMKTMMLSWRFYCDIVNFEKKAKATGANEKFLESAGVSLVPMIPAKFLVDVPGTGAQEEMTIMELHPLICGIGPMSADEPQMGQERYTAPSNDDLQGFPTSRCPSSSSTDRSWTFLERQSDVSF